MLQADGHYLPGTLRRRQALLCLADRPGHGLLAVEVFASGQRIEQMLGVHVQGTGDQHGIDVLHIEEAAMVVVRLQAGHDASGFVIPALIDVGDSHHLYVRNCYNPSEQFLPATADADHAHANTIIRAQHLGRVHQHRSGAQSQPTHEFPSPDCLVAHLASKSSFPSKCSAFPRKLARSAPAYTLRDKLTRSAPRCGVLGGRRRRECGPGE